MTPHSLRLLASPEGNRETAPVSTMLSGSRIREAIEQSTFILGGDPTSVEAVKYDFHLGDRVLKAEIGQPAAISAIPEKDRYIAPGETVFVLTKERLNLPRNMIATLIPKRKVAHGGISVLGGLSVDPEYKGVLVVGMHNFSSTRYQLRPGRKLIAAIFLELSEAELSAYPVAPPGEINDFPDELVDLISKYKPADLTGLQEQLDDTRRELVALKTDLANDKAWRDDFKRDLTDLKQVVSETSRNVTRLGENLDKETTLRAQDDKAIDTRITGMSNMFFGWNLARVVIVALVLIVLSVLAGIYVPKWWAAATQPPAVTAPASAPSTQAPPKTGP